MTELRHFIGAGTLLVAVTAGAAAPDEPGEDLAGGQSGTDAFGSGTCVLDPSSAFEMDFQDVIDWLEVTPQRLSNLAQGSRILSSQGCERDDFVYLDVLPRAGPLRFSGLLAKDSERRRVRRPCRRVRKR
jgi:hypothetical protein